MVSESVMVRGPRITRTRQGTLTRTAPYELHLGDCESVMAGMKAGSVNCVVTSPPYWQQREYDVDHDFAQFVVGNEPDPESYVERIRQIFHAVKRVLADDGSLWLNLGDKYVNKDLVGLPWMAALALKRDGWILRNDIIWNKMKGTQSSKDRLRDTHEYLFHFVKSRSYWYDRDAILQVPNSKPRYVKGQLVSATGVSGVRYRKAITESVELTRVEKAQALKELDGTLGEMEAGEIVDFRMTIRGVQRIYHSNKSAVSGRAKELANRGFYIVKMKASGHAPSTVWNIPSEGTQRRDDHCAVFPTDLIAVPIRATCPVGGTVLDPFMGTGSTIIAAVDLGRRGVGIDISEDYISTTRERLDSRYDAPRKASTQ